MNIKNILDGDGGGDLTDRDRVGRTFRFPPQLCKQVHDETTRLPRNEMESV